MALTEAFKIGAQVIDSVHTSDDERNRHTEEMARIGQASQLGQIETNKVEAAHRSVWVAGWRPYIGWVCGTGIAWNYIIDPLVARVERAAWIAAHGIADAPPIPEINIAELVTILVAMLGSAYLRTYEKERKLTR